MQKVIPEVCHPTWRQFPTQLRGLQIVFRSPITWGLCLPIKLPSHWNQWEFAVVTLLRFCYAKVYFFPFSQTVPVWVYHPSKHSSLDVLTWTSPPITYQTTMLMHSRLFSFFFFFNFISSLPFVSKGTHAQNSTNISPHMRGEFRHNKRRICKQSAKRVGQENDSAGNSWNTSNFNIWEDWSLEHLSGPGSELHQPFFNVMPGINILIPHTENGFSIKCPFGFYMDSIFCTG